MKRIPTSFELGSHTYHVVRLPAADLNKLAGCEVYALYIPDKLAVFVQEKNKEIAESVLLQAFWHEFSHVLLHCAGHKDWRNEKVVDSLGHLLKQFHQTVK